MKNELFGKPLTYYEENHCINTVTEIAQQPAVWRELADTMMQRKEEISVFMDEVLSVPDLRIVTTGAGSSAFVGETFLYMLAGEMGIRTENVHTTDIISAPDETLFDVPTLLISYARSGESPESIAAIRFAQKRVKNLYNIVIVCDKNSSLAKCGYETEQSLVLNLPEKTCDKGFAMTSSVSCMSIATWCLFHYKEMEEYTGYVRVLAEAMDSQIGGLADRAGAIAENDYRRLIWLGTGALKGLSREASIKSMELSDGYVHAGYDAPTGFRHGPKTVINDETLTIHFISNKEYSRKYDADLANEIIREKQKNLVVTVKPDFAKDEITGEDYEVVYQIPKELPENSEMGSYIFSLVFTQLLSMKKSLDRDTRPITRVRRVMSTGSYRESLFTRFKNRFPCFRKCNRSENASIMHGTVTRKGYKE